MNLFDEPNKFDEHSSLSEMAVNYVYHFYVANILMKNKISIINIFSLIKNFFKAYISGIYLSKTRIHEYFLDI